MSATNPDTLTYLLLALLLLVGSYLLGVAVLIAVSLPRRLRNQKPAHISSEQPRI